MIYVHLKSPISKNNPLNPKGFLVRKDKMLLNVLFSTFKKCRHFVVHTPVSAVQPIYLFSCTNLDFKRHPLKRTKKFSSKVPGVLQESKPKH